jgi:hypothetical protein
MGAFEPYRQSQGLGRDDSRGGDESGRFKCEEVQNWPVGRRAAVGAVLELGVAADRVMKMMRRHLRRQSDRTDLQQEGSAVCRHEADGDVGPEQEHYQQKADRRGAHT